MEPTQTPPVLQPHAASRSVPSPHPIDWKYQVQQYGTAVLVAALFFIIFSLYSYYRGGSYDLSIANKVFADVAAILLGFVLLLGPLSRMFNLFDKHVQYRKELGIMVFLLALTHGLVSFFFLPTRFTIAYFLTTALWPFLFGLAGVVLLTALFLSSREKVKAMLGPARWWKFQNWGVRVVLILTALHIAFLEMSRWIEWYQHGGSKKLLQPGWPSTGILIAWFLAFVILIRLIEPMDKNWGKIAWYTTVVLLPAVYVGTFIWGLQFGK